MLRLGLLTYDSGVLLPAGGGVTLSLYFILIFYGLEDITPFQEGLGRERPYTPTR